MDEVGCWPSRRIKVKEGTGCIAANEYYSRLSRDEHVSSTVINK